MEDEVFNGLEMNRVRFHDLWIKAENNDYDDVSEEDQTIMKILMEHREEYGEFFENADMLGDAEFDPETEQNPFMHIVMHTIVENQLRNRDPLEAYNFYLSMLNKKYPRHDTIHLIAAIFIQVLFPVLKYGAPFNNEKYISLFKKYMNRKPDKIFALLEQEDEFGGSEYDI